jgi:hypothetical protein
MNPRLGLGWKNRKSSLSIATYIITSHFISSALKSSTEHTPESNPFPSHPFSRPILVMSFFSGLFGSNAPTEQEPSSSKELFNSATFSSSAQPPSGPASTDSISAPAAPAAPAYTPSASDLFASAYDPAKLHPLAGISDNLEVLQLDDDKLSDVQGAQGVLPSRGWTDDLCVGTGTTYASGTFAL